MLFGYDKVGSDNGFRNFTNGKCEQKVLALRLIMLMLNPTL